MNMQHLSVNLPARHRSSPVAICLHLSLGVTSNFPSGLAVWELTLASPGSTCKRGEMSSLLPCQHGLFCKARGQTPAKPQPQQVHLCLQRQFEEDAVALSPPAQHRDPSVITRILLLRPAGHRPFARALSSGQSPVLPLRPPEPLQAG